MRLLQTGGSGDDVVSNAFNYIAQRVNNFAEQIGTAGLYVPKCVYKEDVAFEVTFTAPQMAATPPPGAGTPAPSRPSRPRPQTAAARSQGAVATSTPPAQGAAALQTTPQPGTPQPIIFGGASPPPPYTLVVPVTGLLNNAATRMYAQHVVVKIYYLMFWRQPASTGGPTCKYDNDNLDTCDNFQDAVDWCNGMYKRLYEDVMFAGTSSYDVLDKDFPLDEFSKWKERINKMNPAAQKNTP